MPLSQAVSFLYNSQQTGLSAEKTNLGGPFVLRALQTWKLVDKLNRLNQLVVTVFKSDIDRNDVFLEREVFVPAFNFTGLITQLIDINDSILKIVINEEAWHFTRRLYKIADSLKEYNLKIVAPASLPDMLEDLIGSANADMPVIDTTEISGLVSLWRLNSTPDDDKGTSNGTWTGTPVYVDSVFHNDKAASFAGAERISTADIPFDFDRLDKFSIAFRFKRKGNPTGFDTLISKMADAATVGWFVGIRNTGGLQIGLRAVTSTNEIKVNSTTLNIPDVDWHYIVVTYSGSGTAAGIKIYLDGILEINDVIFDNLTTSILNNEVVTLGALNTGGSSFTGQLDDVRIYNKELTAKEAEKLFLQTQSGIDTIIQRVNWKLGEGNDLEISNLIALLKFDDDVLDSKGANDGTITGISTFVPGQYSKAGDFDGGVSKINYVTLAPEASFDRERTDPWSTSCFVKFNATGNATFYSKEENSPGFRGIFFDLSGGSLRVFMADDFAAGPPTAIFVTTAFVPVIDRWYYLVATYSGSALASGVKIYVDKVSQTLTTVNDNLGTGTILNAISPRLGERTSATFPLNGQMDDFRFYNKELTQKEVARLFDAKDSFIDKIRNDEVPATTNIDFDIKWKSYHDVLREIALNSLNDVWFENNRVLFGTKGKTFILDRDDKIYEKLSTKIDLDVYGNIINVVGGQVGGTNVHKNVQAAQTDLLYNYERVVSNNNLTDQAAVDGVASRILDDFDSIEPDVKIKVKDEIIHKYNMESGDIIKIISNTETQSVKGFFRIIQVTSASTRSLIKLQFSKTGKFIPRISDSLDILEAALIKIHDVELNS